MTEADLTDDAPGTLIGKYRVKRVLGRGGMGTVYEVQHEGIGKRMALKRLLAGASGPEGKARFLREAQAAARVRHPNVVDVLDVDDDARGPFIVMEFLDGETLAQHLDRQGRLSVGAALDLLLPIASAVGAAHEVGVIHRDLKPSNVLLARSPSGLVPKVVDFGVSKLSDVGLGLTNTRALLGTVTYMSPEQAQGAKHVGPATDQFALGLILYELVTGQRAYDGGSSFESLRAVAEARFAPPRTLMADLDPGFEAVLLRALAQRPEDRYPSVLGFGSALLAFASPRTRTIWESAFASDAPAPATMPTTPAASGTVARTELWSATPPRASAPQRSATPPPSSPPTPVPAAQVPGTPLPGGTRVLPAGNVLSRGRGSDTTLGSTGTGELVATNASGSRARWMILAAAVAVGATVGLIAVGRGKPAVVPAAPAPSPTFAPEPPPPEPPPPPPKRLAPAASPSPAPPIAPAEPHKAARPKRHHAPARHPAGEPRAPIVD